MLKLSNPFSSTKQLYDPVRFFHVFLLDSETVVKEKEVDLGRSRIFSDLMQVIDKILSRFISRNHGQVIRYKDLKI